MATRAFIALISAVAVALSGALFAPPATAAAAPGGPAATLATGTLRLGGADRYATAIQVSKTYAPGVSAVYVATGANFPDALSAAAAASLVDGPLLLTPTATLPDAVANEILRLQPEHIYAIGGTGAVSEKTFNALAEIAPTTRLGDVDRYSTGLQIVDTAFTAANTAFIATGRSFPDALAATGAAGSLEAPVILVDGALGSVPGRVLDTLEGLGVENIEIAGGTGAVSLAIENQLSQRYTVTRHGGGDRYETTARINEAFFPDGSTDTMFLATGANFPDALAGAALAGSLGAPLYVTAPTCVPDSVRLSIARLGATTQVIMGGTSIVSDNAARNDGCLASSAPKISGVAKVGSTLKAAPGAWTAGTAFSYQWLAGGKAIAGAKSTSLTLSASHVGQAITVRIVGTKSGYTSVTRVSGPTSKVAKATPAPKPSRTTPIPGTSNCPSWAPIKGNASSMIYHIPSGAFYSRTNPEECFSTESAARDAGYRKSKR